MTLRKKHLEFIEFLQKKTGFSVSALAKNAKLSDSTLTRFVNKPEFERLSSATLDKLAKSTGYKSYEDFLLHSATSAMEINNKKIEISDAEKFQIYESVKNLMKKRSKISPSPGEISEITQDVITHAQSLKTSFITESLIMYVLEKRELEEQ